MNGLQLSFEASGAGPAVIILHGLFGSGRNWATVARALAPDYRVLRVDLRNHGASPWAETMTYREMAGDVQALIENQQLDKPFVVGHSMGGKTAMALALQDPQAVGGLVVVDIAPVSYVDRMTAFVEGMRGLDAMTLASRTEAQRRLAEAIPDPGTAPFLLQNLVMRNDHFEWRLNLAAIGAAVPDLSGFPTELMDKRYDGPATLIYGTESDYVRLDDIAAFRALFPRLELSAIEGAGHWVHADRPAEFIAALRSALGEAGVRVP